MTPIDQDVGVHSALQSIRENRLVVLLGAGLSIPSEIPSAWQLAVRAKQAYDLTLAPGQTPLPEALEAQAEFFYQGGRLETYYIPRLIDKDAFAGDSNPGHIAVADFLLTGAIRAAVSTNYDTLIEAAGGPLKGTVESALDGNEISRIHEGAPLLKIHGCWLRDRDHTVWTPRQLDDGGTVDGRIKSSAAWLSNNLANTDLLVVGFWSDWNYLNGVIGHSLGLLNPASVTIVDPDCQCRLQRKAEELYAIGSNANNFQHVQGKGEAFLDELRHQFSKSFVRQALRAGAPAHQARTGVAPSPDWLEPAFDGNSSLWQVRRDLEGRSPGEPAKSPQPPPGESLGLTMIELQAAGAVPEGAYWRLPSGQVVRVLNGSNRALDVMKSEYDRDMTPVTSPSVVVAVGADDNPLPGSIARANPATTAKASSVRGAQPDWLTRHSPAYADLLA